MFNLKL
ncbi:hypothetical protein D030_4766A, partial [Vibrio parahaemolyticus AQ3810]